MSTDNPSPANIQQLPDLDVHTTQGVFNLAQLVGQPLILYFYPKDATPGCTTQAQDFRDLLPEFSALGVRILGISRDSMKSHDKFTANECLPFPLASDESEQVCRYYDVIQMKNMYGKMVEGVVRSTFLYNARGELVEQWRKVKPAGHAHMLLEYVRKASGQT
ncbi:MAG: peroxiredoxin [Pseudomonadota bacterium]|nr:peroxiredoxin [Pseudomonadota bacterium]